MNENPNYVLVNLDEDDPNIDHHVCMEPSDLNVDDYTTQTALISDCSKFGVVDGDLVCTECTGQDIIIT